MKDEFVDDSQKIIVSCPKCGDQSAMYLINCNKLKNCEYEVFWCNYCEAPYVAYIESEIKCKIETWSCNKGEK